MKFAILRTNMGERFIVTGVEPVVARTQVGEARGVIPPLPPTAIGAGEAFPEPLAKATETELFRAFENLQPEDLPGLDKTVERAGLGNDLPPVSEKRVKQFMKDAASRGLIEQRGLSIRGYIGAVLPRRK